MTGTIQHLRACPWCGSAARILGDGHEFTDEDGQLVTCTAIACNNDQCQAAGPFLASAKQAIEAWNRVATAMAERPALLAVAEAARKYRDASRAVCEHHEGYDGIDLKGLVKARELDEAKDAAYGCMTAALAKLDEVAKP